jgi:hypothetical protein
MLQQLIHTLFVSIICIIWGLPLVLAGEKYIFKDNYWFSRLPDFLSFTFFAGCISLGIISSWLLLLMPLQIRFFLPLTLVPAIYLAAFQKKNLTRILKNLTAYKTEFSLIEFIYVFFCLSLFLILGSVKPVNLDMQIYHMQIIRWQHEYGTVPGMANLFPRFGQGSSWFNLVSIFYWPALKHTNYSYVNISFVCWFFIWLLFKCKHHLKRNDNRENKLLSLYYFILFLFFMIDWQLYRDASNSTNYDFPVTAFVIMTISYLFESIFLEKSKAGFSPVFVFLGLSVISFKFSAIFLLILLAYYLIIHNKTSRWVLAFIAGIVIILPGLIRNYITTGYPFFPHPLSIASPDWKLPETFAQGYYQFLLNYNRFFNYWMFIGKIPDTPLNWIPYWFKGLLIQHKIVLFLSISSLTLLFIKIPYDIFHKKLRVLVLLMMTMISGWFFSAPDPARFGYSFLLPPAFLVLSLILKNFFNLKIYQFALLVSAVIVGSYILNKIKESPVHIIYPEVADAPSYNTIYKNAIEIHVPEIMNSGWDHRCFDTEVPCLPGDNPFIEPRGKSIKEGFRMSKPDNNFLKKYYY